MNLIKRIIPNRVKQEGKYLLYRLLKMPYNRLNIHLDFIKYLPQEQPINFIDIGASTGTFAEPVSKFYQIEKAILIEPIATRMPLLKSKFPDTDKFEVLNLAVSDKPGECEFYLSEEFGEISSLLKIKNKYSDPFNISEPVKTIVRTETLDDIVSKSKLDIIDLIKIDVQGAEHLVLAGSTNTLKTTKLIFIEISFKPMYDGSCTFFDIYKILSENNFRMVDISQSHKSPNGEVVQGDALFVNNALC